ncbi:MAG: cell division protein FtsA [Prolixibacteraceae bacterium]|nr:cell division protein FtsA [Prolixibacteraceae bacterium]
MASKQEITAIVDIGTSKIRGLVGSKNENGKIEILGHASLPSQGIKRGVVLNIEECSKVLGDLKRKLEEQAGIEIRKVNVTMSGQAVLTVDFECNRYTNGGGFVNQQDIDYIFNEAKNLPLNPGYKIYHIFPQDYTIDDEPGIVKPVGYAGRSVKAFFKMLIGPKSYQDNIEMALSRCGLQLGRLIISSVATSEAVLNSDEKDAGVVVVDVGSGTTSLAVYHSGHFMHSAVVPFAGEVITTDIKEGCSILRRFAEQLKTQFGQAMGDFAEEEKVVTIPGGEGWESKEISFKSLAYIIQARLEEIFDDAYSQIEKSGLMKHSHQGIVLVGGSSRLKNILQILKYRTGMDARLGKPEMKLEKNPEFDTRDFVTALGALKLSLSKSSSGASNVKIMPNGKKNNFFNGITQKIAKQLDIIFSDND